MAALIRKVEFMDKAAKQLNEQLLNNVIKKAQGSLHELDVACKTAAATNKNLLSTIIKDNAETEFGRKHGFTEMKNRDDYRKAVPLTTYSDYEPYIRRMTENDESNLITSYPVVYYAKTSGTSGTPKKIPVTDRGMSVFRAYSISLQFAVLQEHYQTTEFKDMPHGLQMLVINLSREFLANGTEFGPISAACFDDDACSELGYLVSSPKDVLFEATGLTFKYLHARFGLAERDITSYSAMYISTLLDEMQYITSNWKSLVDDIRHGTIDPSVGVPADLAERLKPYLAPNPKRADELEAAFNEGTSNTIMTRIWPNLSSVCAIWAGNFSPYARKLQAYSGKSIPYYTMSYGSSEGIFGVARHAYVQNYVLLPNSCVYEFIPVERRYANNQAQPDTLFIDEIEEGKEYELVITNQSGFYRYRIGDIIQVTGFYQEAPMVIFKYRRDSVVSVAGEKLPEDELMMVVKEFARRSGIDVTDFCLHPDKDSIPGRYVLYIEPGAPVPEDKLETRRQIFVEELLKANTSVAHYVLGGGMGKPELRFLKQGTFRAFREEKMRRLGIAENQLKPVRILDKPELVEFFSERVEEY